MGQEAERILEQVIADFEGEVVDADVIARIADAILRRLDELQPGAFNTGWYAAIRKVVGYLEAIKVGTVPELVAELGSKELGPVEPLRIMLGVAIPAIELFHPPKQQTQGEQPSLFGEPGAQE